MNIADWLYTRALQEGSAPVHFQGYQASYSYSQFAWQVHFQGYQASYSYSQFAWQVQRVAQALSSRYCLQPGDKVALCVKSSTERLVCMFGILWAGATAVLMRDDMAPAEFNQAVRHSGAALALAEVELAVPKLEKTVCVPVPLAELMLLAEKLSDVAWMGRPAACRLDDPACLIYAASNTGKSMGVMLTHQDLLDMPLENLALGFSQLKS